MSLALGETQFVQPAEQSVDDGRLCPENFRAPTAAEVALAEINVQPGTSTFKFLNAASIHESDLKSVFFRKPVVRILLRQLSKQFFVSLSTEQKVSAWLQAAPNFYHTNTVFQTKMTEAISQTMSEIDQKLKASMGSDVTAVDPTQFRNPLGMPESLFWDFYKKWIEYRTETDSLQTPRQVLTALLVEEMNVQRAADLAKRAEFSPVLAKIRRRVTSGPSLAFLSLATAAAVVSIPYLHWKHGKEVDAQSLATTQSVYQQMIEHGIAPKFSPGSETSDSYDRHEHLLAMRSEIVQDLKEEIDKLSKLDPHSAAAKPAIEQAKKKAEFLLEKYPFGSIMTETEALILIEDDHLRWSDRWYTESASGVAEPTWLIYDQSQAVARADSARLVFWYGEFLRAHAPFSDTAWRSSLSRVYKKNIQPTDAKYQEFAYSLLSTDETGYVEEIDQQIKYTDRMYYDLENPASSVQFTPGSTTFSCYQNSIPLYQKSLEPLRLWKHAAAQFKGSINNPLVQKFIETYEPEIDGCLNKKLPPPPRQ